MAEPTINFVYNTTTNDVQYTGTGLSDANYRVINQSTDRVIFTGGGIDDSILTTPTCASGVRSPTIRPSSGNYVIPRTYVETPSIMHDVPMAGLLKNGVPNPNRYVFGVCISGTVSSLAYLESWDDSAFNTTNLEVLQGSPNNGDLSYVNAIRTTNQAPPWSFPPGWDGNTFGAKFLRGTDYRIPLDTASPIVDKTLYWNVYIRLYDDSSTFHNVPVFVVRYLYT